MATVTPIHTTVPFALGASPLHASAGQPASLTRAAA